MASFVTAGSNAPIACELISTRHEITVLLAYEATPRLISSLCDFLVMVAEIVVQTTEPHNQCVQLVTNSAEYISINHSTVVHHV